jgi:hypothetical protein
MLPLQEPRERRSAPINTEAENDMHDDDGTLDNPGADFQTEVDEYLRKAGADPDDPGDLREPAIRSAIKNFDLVGRKIPQWATVFRDTK